MKFKDTSEDEPSSSTQGKRVIINLDETDKCAVDRENNSKEISINGVLSIKNTSSSYRIYNTYLSVSNHGLTDISEGRYPVGEIGPDKSWSKDYSVSTDTPTLMLRETVDANYEDEAEELHRTFYAGKENPTLFKISLRNNFDHEITDIVLKKAMIPELSRVEASAQLGEVDVNEDNRVIQWTIERLKPGEDKTLTLKGIVKPKSSEPVKCGTTEVKFKVEDGARSGIDLDLESLVKSLSGLNISETTLAGKWSFEISFNNASDLTTTLEEFIVTGPEGEVARFTPAADVPAGESWTKTMEFESKEVPELHKEIKFRVAHEVHKSIDGYIFREDDILPVGQITVLKQFEPAEIPAYETFNLVAKLIVENAGSAEFDSIKLVDRLPKDFKPPRAGDVGAAIGTYEIECRAEIDPDDQEHGTEHTITATVPNLLRGKRGLKPSDKLIINYPITAIGARPPSETKYPAPLHATAFSRPPGLGTDAETSAENPPEIAVKYVKRILTGATGFESVEEGVYEITIQVNNKGEAGLENVSAEHWIPPDFEFVEYTPKRLVMEEEETPDGKKVKFMIPRMIKGAGETIVYRVKGKPGAHYKQTEARFKVLGAQKKE